MAGYTGRGVIRIMRIVYREKRGLNRQDRRANAENENWFFSKSVHNTFDRENLVRNFYEYTILLYKINFFREPIIDFMREGFHVQRGNLRRFIKN
jgi:hypothetical protein